MNNPFEAAIQVLNQRKLAIMCGLEDGSDEDMLSAIRILEAAGKVDKASARQWIGEYADAIRSSEAWKAVYEGGNMNWFDEVRHEISALLAALPGGEK